MANPSQRLTLEGHTDLVTCLHFSPDGSRIASGSQDRSVRLWDTATGDPLLTLDGFDATVSEVCFSPDGTHLAVGGADGKVRIWDALPSPLPARRTAASLKENQVPSMYDRLPRVRLAV